MVRRGEGSCVRLTVGSMVSGRQAGLELARAGPAHKPSRCNNRHQESPDPERVNQPKTHVTFELQAPRARETLDVEGGGHPKACNPGLWRNTKQLGRSN